MNIRSEAEIKELRRFIDCYNIQDIKIEKKQRYNVNMDSYAFNPNDYAMFNMEYVNFYQMSIPESNVEKLATVANEFEELMQDPECAELLMKARFINRLKRGRY